MRSPLFDSGDYPPGRFMPGYHHKARSSRLNAHDLWLLQSILFKVYDMQDDLSDWSFLLMRWIWHTFMVLFSCLTLTGISAPVTNAPLLVSAAVQVNQLGYRPNQFKEVIVVGALPANPTFELLNQQGQAVYTGSLVSFGFDSDSGQTVARGNFSAFKSTGIYQINVPGKGASYSFPIRWTAYQPALKLATRFFYLQRSGAAKNDPVTGLQHGPDYVDPAIILTPKGVPTNQTMDASGGWWDAGDYGRYVPPAATTLMSLFYAYHFNPAFFKDGSLNIPESGNGLPDLLDEARWELTWLLKMQRSDGAVYIKATTPDYTDLDPDKDTQPVYVYDITTQSTAQFAGVLAEASLVYRDADPAFADRMLAAAKKAWTWLQAHPNKYPVGGFQNPDDSGGPYSIEGDETGQRLWAAGGLFHATGETAYANAFAALWNKRDQSQPVYGLSWADGYAFGMFAYLNSAGANPTIQNQIRQVVAQQSQTILKLINSTGYHVALKGNTDPFGYLWGSNEYALERALYLLLANEIAPSQKLVDGAAAQLNWIFGVNPLNKAYITGAGRRPIRTLHHMISINRGKAIPGAIGEGPNGAESGGDPVLQAMLNAGVPYARCYADDPGSWATNEPVIYGNAAFVAVAAWFSK